jgi:hypothetical protein
MDDITRLKNLFQSYDPPEGGVQGLREKLNRFETKKPFFSPPRIALVTSFAVILLVASALVPKLIKPRPRSNLFMELVKKSENPAFIKYGYLERNEEAVSIPAGARSHLTVKRVNTSDKNVKFYLVESIN